MTPDDLPQNDRRSSVEQRPRSLGMKHAEEIEDLFQETDAHNADLIARIMPRIVAPR